MESCLCARECRQGIVAAIAGLLVVCCASEVSAQEEPVTMPSGWESFPAAEFTAAAVAYLSQSPKPNDELARNVVGHAWDQFLVTDAGLDTIAVQDLQQLVARVRSRTDWLLERDGVTDREAEQSRIEERMTALVETVQTGLLQELENGEAVDFDSVIEAWDVGHVSRWEPRNRPDLLPRADALAAWMADSDWQSLDDADLETLVAGLQADRVDKAAFSVRWSGFVRPAADGIYRFHQLQHPYGDGACRLFVNDQLVLDTRSESAASDRKDTDFTSSPVTLSVDKPAALRLEYVFDRSTVMETLVGVTNARLNPQMVLLWSREGVAPAIVPLSAYSPPTGTEGSNRGLLAEYFATIDFQQPIGERPDAGVGLIATGAPIFPLHPEELHQAQGLLFERLVKEEYQTIYTSAAAGAAPDGGAPITWRLAHTHLANALDAWNRQTLLEKFVGNGDLSGVIAFEFSKLFEELAMLPGNTRLRLLDSWWEDRPRPQSEISKVPGIRAHVRGQSGFWHMSRWFREAFTSDLETLLKEHLVDDSGNPRLNHVGVAAMALVDERRAGEIREFISTHLSQLDEPGLVSDRRAAWLAARAWCKELISESLLNPGVALTDFEEALSSAASDTWGFYLTREIIARLICLGECEQALDRIARARQQFSDASALAELAALEQHAQRLEPLFAEFIEAAPVEAVRQAHAAHAARLRERIDRAQARGDTAAAAKYQQQLQRLEETTPDS